MAFSSLGDPENLYDNLNFLKLSMDEDVLLVFRVVLIDTDNLF